jgi:hypothetical protein
MSSVRLRLAPPLAERRGGRVRKIASGIARRRLATGIEIVKEERDRPHPGFQVKFEKKTLSDKNQAWARWHLSSRRTNPCMSFAEKRSNVEGLLTDALA